MNNTRIEIVFFFFLTLFRSYVRTKYGTKFRDIQFIGIISNACLFARIANNFSRIVSSVRPKAESGSRNSTKLWNAGTLISVRFLQIGTNERVPCLIDSRINDSAKSNDESGMADYATRSFHGCLGNGASGRVNPFPIGRNCEKLSPREMPDKELKYYRAIHRNWNTRFDVLLKYRRNRYRSNSNYCKL